VIDWTGSGSELAIIDGAVIGLGLTPGLLGIGDACQVEQPMTRQARVASPEVSVLQLWIMGYCPVLWLDLGEQQQAGHLIDWARCYPFQIATESGRCPCGLQK
jgi:hypothetical protein